MYLVGNDAAAKASASAAIQAIVADAEKLVTDVEVFQEILHRYKAINRIEAIQECFDVLNEIVDEVYAFESDDVEQAKAILLGYPKLSARDAAHAAIMKRHGVPRILSFERGFDEVPGIERIGEGSS